ncbi:tryptophan--tRNA ligase [Selenihalanaerobacter shriftii]|uniref:Tryptophan--tRNA ligase n=1 Tax=Selenihalanaerobacter shriftii TaxID=142842 RepID=A0A1T4M7X6_9FIRM|nr:tryptophan--tRNA ligase [Selenihalanaerobacter shriftii]SJZ62947.1 tryptophanyl-tRNA synthetase [Selenihalanaerobacter shriftii]
MSKGRILSGMRPTGRLHVGHLVGVLDNWIKFQDEYDCYFMIADWHALTTKYDQTEDIKDNIRELVIDWISAGIDPEKSVIFLQSDVKEDAELHLLFSMITSVSRLERVPTYKEQIEELGLGNSVPYGLLGYPVLQAADILLYKGDTVPVGKDQLPHLELTREIGRRFNYLYEEIFPEPEPKLTKVPKLLGTDGRKMSKSYGNAIFLADSKDEVEEKVKQMVTDPQRIRLKDPGDPDVCSVYNFHTIFNESEKTDELAEGCRNAGIGCMNCKGNLRDVLVDELAEIRAKRKELEKNPERIDEILAAGAKKAKKVAQATMKEVRSAMNL